MMTNNIAVNSAHMISPASQPAAARENESAGKNDVNDTDHLQETRERVLENVVAVSRDGDTLQVISDEDTTFGTVTERNALAEENDTKATAAFEGTGREITIEQEKTFKREDIFGKDNPIRQETLIGRDDSFDREKVLERDDSSDREKMFGRENPLDRENILGAERPFGRSGENKGITGADSAQEAQHADATSYAGYTDSQMEQLYLRGDISKIEYDLEMEQREQEREAVNGNNKDFTVRMAYNINEINAMMRESQSIEVALSNQSADEPLRADERMKLMEVLEQNQARMGSTISESEKNKQTATQNTQNTQNTPVSVQVDNQTVNMQNTQERNAQNQMISEDGTVRLRIL